MKISDKKLLLKVKDLRSKEQRVQSLMLEHLQEVHKRRLYADLGYSSLFKYMVRELNYSEGAAGQRLGALRLVMKSPDARKLIESGELSLTVANDTQVFCSTQIRLFQS